MIAAPAASCARRRRLTEWFYEDDECWVAECESCSVPMVVWRVHDPDPPDDVKALLHARLAAVVERALRGRALRRRQPAHDPDPLPRPRPAQGRSVQRRPAPPASRRLTHRCAAPTPIADVTSSRRVRSAPAPLPPSSLPPPPRPGDGAGGWPTATPPPCTSAATAHAAASTAGLRTATIVLFWCIVGRVRAGRVRRPQPPVGVGRLRRRREDDLRCRRRRRCHRRRRS